MRLRSLTVWPCELQAPMPRCKRCPFGQFYKPAEERLNQLVAELPSLEAELDLMKVKTVSAEEVVAEAEALYAR